MPQNPWLEISAHDYVNHMSSPQVEQYQMINHCFKEALVLYSPKTIFIPGCTIGNGFEYIEWNKIENVVALDINIEYLNILKSKFNFPGKLQILHKDLHQFDSPLHNFDLIFAALIFEYVNIEQVLKVFCNNMHKKSVLVTILQQPNTNIAKVSKTRYSVLEKLNSIMQLIEKNSFIKIAKTMGFVVNKDTDTKLSSGKIFNEIHLSKAL